MERLNEQLAEIVRAQGYLFTLESAAKAMQQSNDKARNTLARWVR